MAQAVLTSSMEVPLWIILAFMLLVIILFLAKRSRRDSGTQVTDTTTSQHSRDSGAQVTDTTTSQHSPVGQASRPQRTFPPKPQSQRPLTDLEWAVLVTIGEGRSPVPAKRVVTDLDLEPTNIYMAFGALMGLGMIQHVGLHNDYFPTDAGRELLRKGGVL